MTKLMQIYYLLMPSILCLAISSYDNSGLPQIEPFSFPNSLTFGIKTSVSCVVNKGEFPLKFQWLKDGIDVLDYDNVRILNIDYISVLVIDPIKERSGGNYTCVVSNSLGSDEYTAALVTKVPAIFEEKFEVKAVRRGDSFVLMCNVTGDEPIGIVWYKDRKELDITDLSKYEKLEFFFENGVHSELLIKNVNDTYECLYSCLASNNYGSDERNMRVFIVDVPGRPLDVKVLEIWSRGANISWTVPYTGNSAITLFRVQHWRDKDESQIPNEEKISANQTHVMIQQLKPGISYTVAVVAENDIGPGEPSETTQFLTAEEEPSGPPTELKGEARSSTTILVKWKCPREEQWNAELIGYFVGYRPDDKFETYTFKSIEATDKESCEYLLTGLDRSIQYTVLVKAYNKAGEGPPSEELVVRTLDGDAMNIPWNLDLIFLILIIVASLSIVVVVCFIIIIVIRYVRKSKLRGDKVRDQTHGEEPATDSTASNTSVVTTEAVNPEVALAEAAHSEVAVAEAVNTAVSITEAVSTDTETVVAATETAESSTIQQQQQTEHLALLPPI